METAAGNNAGICSVRGKSSCKMLPLTAPRCRCQLVAHHGPVWLLCFWIINFVHWHKGCRYCCFYYSRHQRLHRYRYRYRVPQSLLSAPGKHRHYWPSPSRVDRTVFLPEQYGTFVSCHRRYEILITFIQLQSVVFLPEQYGTWYEILITLICRWNCKRNDLECEGIGHHYPE